MTLVPAHTFRKSPTIRSSEKARFRKFQFELSTMKSHWSVTVQSNTLHYICKLMSDKY